MRGYYLLPILLLLLIAPAHAVYSINRTVEDGNFQAEYTPGSGYLITQVDVIDLDTPSNTSILLTVPGGDYYRIWFNTTYAALGVRAVGGIENSTGTVDTFDKTIIDLGFSYWGVTKSNIGIQYWYIADASEGIITDDAPLFPRLGLIFSVVPAVPYTSWHYSANLAMGDTLTYRDQLLAFGEIDVESTDSSFIGQAWYNTIEEIEAKASGSAYDILEAEGIIADLWDKLLSLIAAIPVVGPPMAIFIDELFWLINFAFIENWLGTIVLIEFLAISEGLIYAKKRGNIALMKRVASNHIVLFGMIVTVMMFLYERIIIRAIEVIADLIPG